MRDESSIADEIDDLRISGAEPSTSKPKPSSLTGTFLDSRAKIPPRQWAYGNFLLFGTAAVIGAVDGGGKGALAVAIALSMITGRPLLGEKPWRTGPVAIVSYEDDCDEWRRRISAACFHFGIDYELALANFLFITKASSRISFADTVDGQILFPDGDEIITLVKESGCVALIVDPFNHCHGFDDGNNNVMIAKVAAEMMRVAHESKTAALVLHHLRKGASGIPDDLMGATSLRATFRSCRILARMTPEIAEKLGIPPTDAWRYIQIVGSKQNYAPPPERGKWFRLASVSLGNQTNDYPDGDSVGVATPWQPRPIFDGMDAPTLRQVFDALRKERHGPNRQARNTPWAGVPLMAIAGRAESEAKQIVAAWLDSGTLTKGTFRSKDRHELDCVTLDEARVEAILAQMESPGAADL